MTDIGNVDVKLSEESEISKSAIGLMSWWIKTYLQAVKKIRLVLDEKQLRNAFMVVHGDTVSTFMGARIGHKLGMVVCHIEAGLRSHHLFNPFPEEIDRLLTSRNARLHFAPGGEAVNNLKNVKGQVINTQQNTLLDSLHISERFPVKDGKVKHIVGLPKPYFVFVMHRQENLANERFVRQVVDKIEEAAKNCHAIIILHTLTKNTFMKLGLIERLKSDRNVTLLPRVEYFDFMKLLQNSDFVITDGGSNQEELYYMGKPTLIMRKNTERNEGIGENAILYNSVDDIISFSSHYNSYSREQHIKESPSMVVANKMIEYANI